jgi:hypothetical protein
LRWHSSTKRRDIVRQRLRLSRLNRDRKRGRELVRVGNRRCLSTLSQRLAALLKFSGSLFLLALALILHLLEITSMLS